VRGLQIYYQINYHRVLESFQCERFADLSCVNICKLCVNCGTQVLMNMSIFLLQLFISDFIYFGVFLCRYKAATAHKISGCCFAGHSQTFRLTFVCLEVRGEIIRTVLCCIVY